MVKRTRQFQLTALLDLRFPEFYLFISQPQCAIAPRSPPLQSSNLGSFQQNDLKRREAAVHVVSFLSLHENEGSPRVGGRQSTSYEMLPHHELKGPIFSLAPPFTPIVSYSFGFTVTLARSS
ncbi:hypothetical protein PILCRDRAFT_459580 [Piloderma croceum F 1598]|uniref:Uncharacterized protein n=1 Tax=Piloderma croceum (strain F 1598) TaxID=765440 RepID=A0A0C3B9A0_PILCF|nr:hypothetical protein PILCRDRAFT_459580 [Piloderma croceum F 1598]